MANKKRIADDTLRELLIVRDPRLCPNEGCDGERLQRSPCDGRKCPKCGFRLTGNGERAREIEQGVRALYVPIVAELLELRQRMKEPTAG